jgi:uncharacterized membrane protein YkvA (DUF1232 family)
MTNNGNMNGGNGTMNQNGGGGSRAEEYLEEAARHVTERDINRLKRTVPEKLKKLDMSDLNESLEWVKSLVGQAGTLFEMIRDKEFRLNGKSKTLIAAGLIYLVLPVDMVPDFIPGLGYLDDALILSTLWKIVQSEVERYQLFRSSGL